MKVDMKRLKGGRLALIFLPESKSEAEMLKQIDSFRLDVSGIIRAEATSASILIQFDAGPDSLYKGEDGQTAT